MNKSELNILIGEINTLTNTEFIDLKKKLYKYDNKLFIADTLSMNKVGYTQYIRNLLR